MSISIDRLKEIIGETVEGKIEKKIYTEMKPYTDEFFERLNKPKKNKMFGTPDEQDKAVFGYNRKA
ncbi:unnamed protein product, partial [marine sediment metagenome]